MSLRAALSTHVCPLPDRDADAPAARARASGGVPPRGYTALTPLLELKNVTRVFTSGSLLKKRAPVTALDQVTFAVADDHASVTAVAGESGSGKTTLAHLLLGHLSPTSGQVLYRGRDLAKMGA